MLTIPKVVSEETKMTSLGHTKIPIINDPVDLTRISKADTRKLTISSVIKAGIVSSAVFALYYLAKTTNTFSHFGWEAKDLNSKNVENREITKIKNKGNSLIVRRDLETTSQNNVPFINQITQANKDNSKTVKFEEIEIKNLSEVKEKNSETRRSISIKNPIPNQKIAVGLPFNLTIDGTYVFNSSGALFLEATNIPTWLTSLNPNPTFKGSYDIRLANRVALSGNYAYVADSYSGLQSIDISDPSNPTFKGSYVTPRGAQEVALSGNYAYVVGDSLQIIDIIDPANPTFKGSYNMPDSAVEVALSGNYA